MEREICFTAFNRQAGFQPAGTQSIDQNITQLCNTNKRKCMKDINFNVVQFLIGIWLKKKLMFRKLILC